jgi:acetyl-CoA acetyltransferase family protein
MREAVIVDGARLPVAKGGPSGALCMIPAEIFGGYLIRELVKRSGINPAEVEDVILGNVMGAYLCFARLCLLEAGLPVEVPGVTLDRNCSSGLQAIAFASQAIRVGEADLIIAGGVDSMTRQPWFLEKPATGFSREALQPRILAGGRNTAPPAYGQYSMGETAENVAEQYNVTRKEQEQLTIESHTRAAKAWEEGIFKEEVIPFPVPSPPLKRSTLFERDETIRVVDPKKIASLPTIFRKDGTVTAATSSPVSDGAAAVIMMSREKAEQAGFKPILRVVATASSAVDPAYMGLGPIPATRKVLQLARMTIDDIDLVEFNEAFASQALVCYRELGLTRDKVNVNGGGLALGHPIGATGARLTVTLMYEMKRRNVRYGLATMCVGGGQGTAIIYEALT